MKKILTMIILGNVLTGCSSSQGFDDIKSWMDEEKKGVVKKIEQIPEAKVFQPIDYEAKADPFKEKQVVTLDKLDKDKYAPDKNRRKESLEAFSIDQLKIIGMVKREGKNYAIIRTPEGKNSYITVGNYIGTNYGLITSIDENTINIEERVLDADEWKIKNTLINFEQ